MKKRSITSLKNELWSLTSKFIRSQSSYCYTCDKVLIDMKDRQAGHFWSRGGHDSVRFDLDNIRVQCVSCNNFKSGNLAEYAVRLRREIGTDAFNSLSDRAHQIIKRDRQWYLSSIDTLKSLLHDIQTN